MAIFRENGLESFDLLQSPAPDVDTAAPAMPIPIVGAKLDIPVTSESFEREWLLGLLDKYSTVGSGTLVIGRAGTGKTSLVADFVRKRRNVSWYTMDSGDSDWCSFQRYLRAAWKGSKSSSEAASLETSPAELLTELVSFEAPSILVLDNIHHLYDCRWFPDFFSVLLASIPDGCHLILLGRSKPPAPVWRLRSKQVLNIIDEKLLAFSLAEATALFQTHKLSEESATSAHRSSFGRAAELFGQLEKMRANAG